MGSRWHPLRATEKHAGSVKSIFASTISRLSSGLSIGFIHNLGSLVPGTFFVILKGSLPGVIQSNLRCGVFHRGIESMKKKKKKNEVY